MRRAPFSDNPNVGPRGQRTQQRILDAALQVFGEEGYHRCSIDRIATLAGCSRVSFYQYFSSKEDVFRHLAGQVARQLRASTEALDPLTPDADGWTALRAWVARHGDIYERYEPVYHAFPAAAESDEAVAGGSARSGERNLALRPVAAGHDDPAARQLDPVVGLLCECLTRTLDIARHPALGRARRLPRERVDDAVTDVLHRTPVRPAARGERARAGVRRPPRRLRSGACGDVLQRDGASRASSTAAGRRALDALLEAGRDVIVSRGYQGTRVDDVVAAAGVSHGAFYRYFENKDELAQILAVRAMRRVSTALAEIPDVAVDDGSAGRRGAAPVAAPLQRRPRRRRRR